MFIFCCFSAPAAIPSPVSDKPEKTTSEVKSEVSAWLKHNDVEKPASSSSSKSKNDQSKNSQSKSKLQEDDKTVEAVTQILQQSKQAKEVNVVKQTSPFFSLPCIFYIQNTVDVGLLNFTNLEVLLLLSM